MASELDRICKLLESDAAELQCAAAMVLGALKPKDAGTKKALVKALKSSNDNLRLYAAEALAAIDAKEALPHLVPLLGGDAPTRHRVTEILIPHGAAAAKILRDQLRKADTSVRKGILDVLAQLPDVDSTETLFAGLLDPDLDVVRKAADAYRPRILAMSDDAKRKALKKILEFTGSPKVQKQKTPIAACLRLIAVFADASAVKAVLPYVDRKQPPAVRAQALLTLGQLPLEGTKGVTAKMLPLLGEKDLNAVVRPALDVLRKAPVEKAEQERVLKLLKSPLPPVRNYALRALGSAGGPKAASALLEALLSSDQSASDTAAHALRTNPDFVPALVKAMGKQKEPAKAWRIGHLLQNFKNVLDKKTVKSFLSSALAMLAKKQSGFQLYFEIVRQAAPDATRAALLKKGRELLTRKKSEDAERHLRLLARDDLATPESDLALACAQLQNQRKDLGQAGRDRGPALGLFSKLVRGGFPLAKTLQKDAKFLTSEDLLYLGFSLVERQGTERDAGAEVLKFVAKKFGSREHGKIAKQKLKTQGL